MNAILCKKYGQPSELVYESVDDPTIGDHQALVKVNACSVNFPDVLMIQGKYQVKPPFPFSPGSDIAGVVEAVGPKVKHIKPGDQVIGIVPYGGFAEKVAIDAALCIPKPAGMPDVKAASFLFTYGTSYYALNNIGELKAGETLLVLGASGGVGLTAVELGVEMGATVIAAASTQEKLDLCKSYGAHHLINYTEVDLKKELKALTDGRGVDVIYDPVGGQYTEPSLRAIAWRGRFLVIGFAAGEIPKIPLNLPLLKGCDIRGVFFGGYLQKSPRGTQKLIADIIAMYQAGKLNPHIQKTFALEDAPKALEMMQNRLVKGKIVIDMTI